MHARATMAKTLCLILLALSAGGCSLLGTGKVTTRSLLAEMTDPAANARWPQPEYKVTQASSYDRRTVTPDDGTREDGWFANGDHSQFLRTEDNGHGQQENVLMDVDGPGSLVRMWFTCRYTTDTLRIYLDGAKEPALEGTFDELILKHGLAAAPLTISNGAVGGRNPGGINIHLPIPYARHCKVTWSQGAKQSRYYNLEYRTYPKGTKVRTWKPADAKRGQAARVAQTLLSPKDSLGRQRIASLNVAAGGTRELPLPDGPAALSQLEIFIKPSDQKAAMEQILRSTILRISFDGHETVWAPLGDFFGSGVGLNEVKSWYRNVGADGTMSCRWTMPYRKDAKITVLNLSNVPVSGLIRVTTNKWKWDDRSLYFHACWRLERAIPTRPFRDWNYIEVKGKGVYLGDTLSVFNPVKQWWGEGDEKIYQDGAAAPTHIGTGSEDYYGYAWCSTQLFQGPFSNQVRCDGPNNMGHSVVSRVRALDRIPFSKDFKIDIEVWNWNKETKVDYAVTTYWYGAEGASCNRTPQPEAAALPVSQVQ